MISVCRRRYSLCRWQVSCHIHVPALPDRIRLVVLAIDVVTSATCIQKQVRARVRRVRGSEAEGLCIRIIPAIRHHAETPRNWLWEAMQRRVANGKVLAQLVERARLCRICDGFFMSDAEEAEGRHHDFEHTTERLEALWEEAIADATQARSFDKLCEYLAVGDTPLHGLPKPISWRFSMMPYGRDDPDAKTFGFAASDTPNPSTNLLLDAGSTGDYIDRKDNKPNPIRKGRHMYVAAYLPPTK